MKRIATILTVVMLGGALPTSAAFAASANTTKAKPDQAVAGLFKSKSAAMRRVDALSAKGFSGFRVETEKRGDFSNGRKYEVEKSYTTQKRARAEVAKLHKAGFKRAYVENERSEKKVG